MRDMRALIRRLADGGMTVLLSSHLMPEVEELCNRVAIVRSGAIVYEGAIADLKRTPAPRYRLRTTDDERAPRGLPGAAGIADARLEGGAVRFAADEDAAAELSLALVEAGALIWRSAPQTATLEDLFFKLTEGESRRTARAGGGRRVNPARAHRLPLGADASCASRSAPTSGSARRSSCRSSSSVATTLRNGGPDDVAVRALHPRDRASRSRSCCCCSARSGCTR